MNGKEGEREREGAALTSGSDWREWSGEEEEEGGSAGEEGDAFSPEDGGGREGGEVVGEESAGRFSIQAAPSQGVNRGKEQSDQRRGRSPGG